MFTEPQRANCPRCNTREVALVECPQCEALSLVACRRCGHEQCRDELCELAAHKKRFQKQLRMIMSAMLALLLVMYLARDQLQGTTIWKPHQAQIPSIAALPPDANATFAWLTPSAAPATVPVPTGASAGTGAWAVPSTAPSAPPVAAASSPPVASPTAPAPSARASSAPAPVTPSVAASERPPVTALPIAPIMPASVAAPESPKPVVVVARPVPQESPAPAITVIPQPVIPSAAPSAIQSPFLAIGRPSPSAAAPARPGSGRGARALAVRPEPAPDAGGEDDPNAPAPAVIPPAENERTPYTMVARPAEARTGVDQAAAAVLPGLAPVERVEGGDGFAVPELDERELRSGRVAAEPRKRGRRPELPQTEEPPVARLQTPDSRLQPPDSPDWSRQLVGVMREALGARYTPTGTSPRTGLSSGGLVHWVFRRMGVRAVPQLVEDQMEMAGVRLDGVDYKPQVGDLLFFAIGKVRHVGLYFDPTQNTFLTVVPAKGGVVVADFNHPFFRSRFLFARRISAPAP
jgi:cell wall-associated NlpC family hydrolase